MAVVAEIWCRPTRFQRWWCALIGFHPPTCGLLRGGPLMDDSGRPLPFEIACGFCARDHLNAELEAFPARPVVPSDVKDATRTLAAHGLKVWFQRRDGNGAVRKKWRSAMHKDIPVFAVGHELSHKNPDFARGAAAIESGKQKLTVVAVVEHGDKDRYITVHQQDLT